MVHIQAGLMTLRHFAEFIRASRVTTLMVAGNRESRQPSIGERVERYLIAAFGLLRNRLRPTAYTI